MVDAGAFGDLRPPRASSVHVAGEHRCPPWAIPKKAPDLSNPCQPVTGSGILPWVDGFEAVHVVRTLGGTCWRTSRALQSSHRRPWRCRGAGGSLVDGTEGRGPSLHMDASASILRPLSPYGPDGRGLPSFPRFPVLRCCGSSARRGIMCCGIGGQGAWQPSLRSGRLRRPARAEQDSSRRRTPCPQCLEFSSGAGGSLLVVSAYSVCVRLLGWTHPHPLRSRHFPSLKAGGGRTVWLHSFGAAGRQSPACTGAQVFALFPHR